MQMTLKTCRRSPAPSLTEAVLAAVWVPAVGPLVPVWRVAPFGPLLFRSAHLENRAISHALQPAKAMKHFVLWVISVYFTSVPVMNGDRNSFLVFGKHSPGCGENAGPWTCEHSPGLIMNQCNPIQKNHG